MSEIIYNIDGGDDITVQQADNINTVEIDTGCILSATSFSTGTGNFKFQALSTTAYEALTSYDNETLYFIFDAE